MGDGESGPVHFLAQDMRMATKRHIHVARSAKIDKCHERPQDRASGRQ